MSRFLSLLLAVFLLSPGLAAAQTERLGRCHMGECGWTREVTRDLAGTSARGYLLRLEIVRGVSVNTSGGSAQRKPIKWDRKAEDTWVFCSKSLPAVMFTLDGELQTHLLDLYPKGRLAGYQEAGFALYMAACHNINVHRKYEDPSVYAERFRYEARQDLFRKVSDGIKKPEDILTF